MDHQERSGRESGIGCMVWACTARNTLSQRKCYANMSAFRQGKMIHCHSLCHTKNVMWTWVLSIEGKWYTATRPLSHRRCYANMSAFRRGKMIHCHSPFVAPKMLCEHECFPSRENDTLPLALCRTKNVVQTWVLSIEGKWFTTILYHKENVRIQFIRF